MSARSAFAVFWLAVLSIGLLGCGGPSANPASAPSITDGNALTADVWNDGQAEVAFYRVERARDQYGNANEQQFLVGSYLVKHRFSPEEMTKTTDGSGVSSFKYSLFYELESGSYQYKRNWVVNARQEDLRPYKQSFTSFDWCSNLYREMAFTPDGRVEVRMRSDDYGNRRTSFGFRPQSYPAAQIPLLVRGLDLSRDTLSFSVAVADSGAFVPAQAVVQGRDSVETEAGRFAAERIEVTYEAPVPSPIAETAAQRETYWVEPGPQRRLLRVEGGDGRYHMTLVEHLRTPYWKENIWNRLASVQERP
jgi:hypothetical protein